MEYRNLGKSGLRVSALSFGSWVTFHNQVDTRLATKLMAEAYESGINFFDNAEVYADGESETIMGKSLKELNWKRDTYCVSSKVFWGGKLPTQRGLNKKHVFDACNAALKRLQVEYLDLYFCHRPDYHTPIEETVQIMNTLINQGKILYWGTSEWSASEIAQAHIYAREAKLIPPTMEQPQYNLFERHKVELDYSRLYDTVGLGTTIWSPLASGILTGKYKNGIPSDSRMNIASLDWLRRNVESEAGKIKIQKAIQLEKVAQKLGVKLSQLAISWCLQNKNVSTVILGASKVEQLQENLKALDVVKLLNDEVLNEIEAIVGTKPQQPIDYLISV